MAKMRGIKPEFWTDEKVVSVSRDARLLFIGIWNHACDNGHVDDSPIQLKMRVFPADNIDVAPLIEELIKVGLLVRENGYLKVSNLSTHQSIDKRYLSLCDHCAHDVHPTFTNADRLLKPQVGNKNTTSTQRAHVVHPPSTQRAHATEGEGEGEGEGEKKEGSKEPSMTRKRATIPTDDFRPSDTDNEWAAEKYPDVDTSMVTEKFVNYCIANGKTYKDHGRAWRNFVSNSPKYDRPAQTQLPQRWTPPAGSPMSYVEM